MRAIVLAILLITFSFPVFAGEQDSVYDRVMKSGKIRCGYGVWGAYLNKDPNTGKMGGIYYDYMEQLGKNLGLKIEWAEEVGWGDYIAGLENDRFDAYCTVVTLNAERARSVDFLTPIFYLPSDIFVAANDARFDAHPDRINSTDVTMITVEGDIYAKIANAEFPMAKKMELSQLATPAELFLSLATGKGDVVLMERSSGVDYMKANPGKIKKLASPSPFRASPESISIKGGEYRFQRMLDIATIEMLSNGTIDKILKDNDPAGVSYVPVAKMYETNLRASK